MGTVSNLHGDWNGTGGELSGDLSVVATSIDKVAAAPTLELCFSCC